MNLGIYKWNLYDYIMKNKVLPSSKFGMLLIQNEKSLVKFIAFFISQAWLPVAGY